MTTREKLRDRGRANEVKGTGEMIKGRVKDVVGSATGDRAMEAEGKLEELGGRIRRKTGEVQRDVAKDRGGRH
jgi:uncharacterized protein YjbJ (UPF0337 family)